MKIVFWNCNDGFQKKYSKLDEISADLYIVAECRDINNDKFTTFRETHKNIMYLKQDGDIKGLLIYSNKDKFTKQDWNDYNMDYYLPICFQDKKILCVWTKHGYIEDGPVPNNFNYVLGFTILTKAVANQSDPDEVDPDNDAYPLKLPEFLI